MRIGKLTLALTLAGLLCGLASASALADSRNGGGSDADEILQHIERILFDVERAQRIMDDRPHRPRNEYSRAQAELRRKEAELERARIEAMSAATGVPRTRIVAMRAHGRSWEGIALDLGVNPRVVGLPGHYGDGPWAGHPRYRKWHGDPHRDHRPGHSPGHRPGPPPGHGWRG